MLAPFQQYIEVTDNNNKRNVDSDNEREREKWGPTRRKVT